VDIVEYMVPTFLAAEKPLSCLYCSTACTSYVYVINLGRSLRTRLYTHSTAKQFQYTMAYLFGTGLNRYQHKWEKRVAETLLISTATPGTITEP